MTAPFPADVLERARGGDARAFRAIYEAHAALVHGFLRRMLGDDAAAEDALQEAFIRVVRALPAFDPAGPARLSTWIVTIARRVALDALDARNRAGRPTGPDEQDIAPPHSDAAERADLRHALEAAITALPEPQRTVFVLNECSGLSYQEIAEIEKIDLGTVKSRLHRARAALQEKLRAHLSVDERAAEQHDTSDERGNRERRATR